MFDDLFSKLKEIADPYEQIKIADAELGANDGNSYYVMSKPMDKGVIRCRIINIFRSSAKKPHMRLVIDYSDNSNGVHLIRAAAWPAVYAQIECAA